MATAAADPDRRARGFPPAHVADPRVRAARHGALRGEADPRLRASLHRHGGDRRRRVRGAPARRLHHEHPPRPWPLHRQGPRSRPDDGRDHRPRGRLLPRSWRQHAHHRDRAGHAGADAIVAGSSALAVGAAHGLKLQGSDNVVVCFFGDGASNQGILHEACNLAAVLDAQVVFVCENNQWAISTPASASTRIADIADAGRRLRLPGRRRRRQRRAGDARSHRDGRRTGSLGRGPDADRGQDLPRDSALGRDEDRSPADRRARRLARARPDPPARPAPARRRRAPRRGSRRSQARARREVESAIEFALASPRPEPGAAVEDVYAPSDWNADGRLA